jgi:hypothetical protein
VLAFGPVYRDPVTLADRLEWAQMSDAGATDYYLDESAAAEFAAQAAYDGGHLPL